MDGRRVCRANAPDEGVHRLASAISFFSRDTFPHHLLVCRRPGRDEAHFKKKSNFFNMSKMWGYTFYERKLKTASRSQVYFSPGASAPLVLDLPATVAPVAVNGLLHDIRAV